MIRLLLWPRAGGAPEELPADRLPASANELPADAVLWVDLDNPTPDEEEWALRRFFAVHSLTFEDVTKPRRHPGEGAHLPKAEEFADYLFVVVNPLPPSAAEAKPERRSARISRPQLSAILTENVLFTHHYEPLGCVAAAAGYAQRHPDCGGRGPDYLFHLVLDAMVDEYAPTVERLADRLDRIERTLFVRPSPEQLQRLLRLKRRVSFLRKTLLLEREVIFRLQRGDFALVDAREVAYYRNVYDHVVRYSEMIDHAREMVSDLMESHLSATSLRLNEVMKVLTMISTVVLPMNLVAGVYGMNFERNVWPPLDSTWGFPAALAMMTAFGAACYVLFRWRRWI